MAPWVELTQTIVGTAVLIGGAVHASTSWFYKHTVKRDIDEQAARINALQSRLDGYNESDVWGRVQAKISALELDQKLMAQHIGYLDERVNTLTADVKVVFDRRQRPR